jgi:WD40 repeat protein
MAGLGWNLSTKDGVSLDSLNNTLVIEDRQNSTAQPYTATCLSPGSKVGGDLSAIGTFVFSFTGSSAGTDVANGTSFASPQAAGLAAYVWALAPELKPQDVLSILTRTARNRLCTGNVQAQPVIDAYSAVLAVDDEAALDGGGPDKAPVRMTILDVVGNDKSKLGGDGDFDEHDIERFLDEITNGPGYPNYSRFDLNGDGYTGGKTTDRFNLDIDAAQTHGEVKQEIAGKNVTFNERSVTDLKVLCYYAYSDLRTGDDAKRDQLMRPHLSKCTGSALAFMRTPLDTWHTEVYTMTDTGTNQKAVTDWKGQFSDAWGLSWAPDERMLMSLPVFSVDYEYYDIFLMNSDGTGLQNITSSNGIDELEPAWHPNGQMLAFTDFNSIYGIFVNGLGRAELDTSSNYTARTPEHPAFSSVGTKVAFSDWKEDNRGHIFVHDLSTGQTTDIGLGWNPAWSPDGSLIAFAGGDGLEELWVMSSSDGSGRTMLHRLSNDYSYMITDIAWSPDGNQIAFEAIWYSPPAPHSDDYDIYMIGVDGTGFKNITKSLGVYERFPAWAP